MKLLDLFCGAGGAAMGYSRAGFDQIVGVDIKPQPRYPFHFVQADALEFCKSFGAGFDAIHASPPCQAYAITNNIWKKADTYPDLVGPSREALERVGRPFVIENVPGAPVDSMFMMCGTMFGLRVIRHRLFETSPSLMGLLPSCAHLQRASYGRTPKDDECFTISGHFGDVAGARLAMGIDWMTRDELAQAIPPAYTQFIGKQLLEHLRCVEQAS